MAARAAPLLWEARPLPQLPLRPLRHRLGGGAGPDAGDGVGAAGQEPKGAGVAHT